MTRKPVTLSLTLPMPPSINAQYTLAKGTKKRVLTKTARDFKKRAGNVILLMQQQSKITPVEERAFANSLLGVYMTFYFETPMRRDLDGGLKIALDTIATSLGFDDRNVVDLHLTKQIDPLDPRLEVEIETIADWTFDREYVLLTDDTDES
ncbi:MAG TPA: RusA family crossover junction endodeoxyribonuclease [Thermomicrobiales bacterium]|nr:RusA family crossover junction endodeoxyribonuclease [Thermomicrobiales bacterium]